MPLRKWCSNSKVLLSQIPCSQADPTFLLRLNEEDTISTLGLSWQPSVDQFRFLISPYSAPARMTKRTVLVIGKIFVQQLWSLKLEWDALLPVDLQVRWNAF